MKRNIIFVIAAMAIVIILAIVADYAGNVAIRRVQQQSKTITFSLNQPVVLGVDTVVHWQVPTGATNTEVALNVRTLAGEIMVGKGRLGSRGLTVAFPCSINYDQATLVLLDQHTGEVLTWTPLLALPAGHDCFK